MPILGSGNAAKVDEFNFKCGICGQNSTISLWMVFFDLWMVGWGRPYNNVSPTGFFCREFQCLLQ
jgi:hypothetical protein